MTHEVNVVLKDGMHFEGVFEDNVVVSMDSDASVGGQGKGISPKPLLLVSLGGCTGMDVISILRKKRQDVTGFEVRIKAEAADTHPKVYTHIHITYVVTGKGVAPAAVERAIQLSLDHYCPVANLLKPVVPIDTSYEIIEA